MGMVISMTVMILSGSAPVSVTISVLAKIITVNFQDYEHLAMGYSYLIPTNQDWLIECHSAIVKIHLNLLQLNSHSS